MSIYRYIDKFMSIYQKMSIFQQIYVNISNKCQYFIKFMSNPSMEGRFPAMGVGRYPQCSSPEVLVIYRYISVPGSQALTANCSPPWRVPGTRARHFWVFSFPWSGAQSSSEVAWRQKHQQRDACTWASFAIPLLWPLPKRPQNRRKIKTKSLLKFEFSCFLEILF